MKLEIMLNRFDDNEWWFDLGISCQKIEYPPNKKWVFTAALIFFTVYLRW